MLQASPAYGAMGQILGASALLRQAIFWAEQTPNEGQLLAEAFEVWRKKPKKVVLLTKYLTAAHLNHLHLKQRSVVATSDKLLNLLRPRQNSIGRPCLRAPLERRHPPARSASSRQSRASHTFRKPPPQLPRKPPKTCWAHSSL